MATPQQDGKEEDVKLHCNTCVGTTFHRLLHKTQDDGCEEWDHGDWFQWVKTHEMFECRGCKSVLMGRTYADSEDPESEVRYFPPRTSRSKPIWYHKLPAQSQVLLSEIYKSLDANNRSLPLMGARALLDMLIVDKVGDVGRFPEKMQKLESIGIISKKNREILKTALDAGNAAAHRGYVPTEKTENSVMDIVENLLEATYVLEEVATDLKKTIPPRPPRPPKSPKKPKS